MPHIRAKSKLANYIYVYVLFIGMFSLPIPYLKTNFPIIALNTIIFSMFYITYKKTLYIGVAMLFYMIFFYISKLDLFLFQINCLFLIALLYRKENFKIIAHLLSHLLVLVFYFIFQQLNFTIYVISVYLFAHLIYFLFSCTIVNNELKKNIEIFIITTTLLLIILEIIFRLFGTYDSIFEKSGQRIWGRIYQSGIDSWYIDNMNPNDSISITTNELSYSIKTNTLSLRNDFDFKIDKLKNTYRIGAFGDSFTLGVAVNNDSTWVSLLRDNLTNQYKNNKKIIEEYNCGIGSSDPYFSYKLLQRQTFQI
ncbi:MAG: hypothetical protein M9958_00635 [Chitinophagales bacterium]|nr:hypothetical protein [Chitinophagales bacterium]